MASYLWQTRELESVRMDVNLVNNIVKFIRATSVDISRPSVTLKKPIKHVFIIILESIRADALPLSDSLANAVRTTFSSDATADIVTPLLNSLWSNSTRTVASVTASYTLKSLISTFCGIYPLNINFLAEVNEEHTLYEKCLPKLVRETFRTENNQSAFRSAFFTAARDDFDHQRDLFTRLNFDATINGFDIYDQVGEIPNLGMFGPPDLYILPLMWKWIDKTLTEGPNNHLMTSLLVTGTHEPFPMPDDMPSSAYHYYVDDNNVNNYLNTMRVSDDFLKEIIDGYKSRNLYDDTLFVITSDHGYVFNDYGRETLGLLSTPLECALTVPLMLYNPHLEAKHIDGQFTNMDILPTVMDVLLSSLKPKIKSKNQLSSVPVRELQSILSRYEGTSMLRMPSERQSVRYTYHLANPGNSYVIVKQYPKKLAYNTAFGYIHLYHLQYDPYELFDLMNMVYDGSAEYPSWVDPSSGQRPIQTWNKRWDDTDVSDSSNPLFWSNSTFMLLSKSNAKNNGTVNLNEMLTWGDNSLELARLWKNLVKQRYRNKK